MRSSVTAILALAAATTALANGAHAGMSKQRRAHTQAAKRGSGWSLDTYAEVRNAHHSQPSEVELTVLNASLLKQGQDFLNLFNFETGVNNGGVANCELSLFLFDASSQTSAEEVVARASDAEGLRAQRLILASSYRRFRV